MPTQCHAKCLERPICPFVDKPAAFFLQVFMGFTDGREFLFAMIDLDSTRQIHQSDSEVRYCRKFSRTTVLVLAGTSGEVEATLFWDQGKSGSFLITAVVEAPLPGLFCSVDRSIFQKAQSRA